jgi:aminodeoxychorismate lyase
MIVFLNGRFLPESDAVISVFDRGFLYGDGLFETLRVVNGKPFRWREHIRRLQNGAEFLRIRSPFAGESLRGFADELVRLNQMPDSLLRITLSRGPGVRGYSPSGADTPTVVMSLHPAPPVQTEPPGWHLVTSSFRLPANEPLAQFKTCNKLPQILARSQADTAGVQEALLLNTDGFIVEASSSNLFWLEDGCVWTPPPAVGVLPGVTRSVIMEICAASSIPIQQIAIPPEKLPLSEGVFLSLSSAGVVEALTLDGTGLARSPLVKTLFNRYWDLVRHECR